MFDDLNSESFSSSFFLWMLKLILDLGPRMISGMGF